LKRKCKERLGKGGIHELKEHAWLRGVNWSDIYRKEVESPYRPREGDNFDAGYCNRIDPIEKTYDYYLQKINNENFFDKFYFNHYDPNREMSFEYDGMQYKFNNPYEDKIQESTVGRQFMKNSTAISTLTPRYDRDISDNSLNITQLPSSRKFVSKL
jgi:hypothetical protein